MRARWLVGLLAGIVAGSMVLATGAAAQARPDSFDHPEHAKLFPRCETCHVGAVREGASIWPTTASCESCHDGTIEKRVRWTPRTGPVPGNLKFDHLVHRRSAGPASARTGATAPTCASCHQPTGSGWMTTRRAIVGQCLDCHKLPTEHLAVADTACATCHLSLVEARTLPEARIKAFGTPPSHKAPGFMVKGVAGHGELAKGTGPIKVAASCSTCHARDFCISCHVNAPETPLIQALGPDARSLAIKAELKAPASHRGVDFDRRHGVKTGPKTEKCSTCHTRESCTACHAGVPAPAVRALASAGPGRAEGAQVVRKKPANHTAVFGNQHASAASAAERSCSTCHVRTMCLSCHRPDAGRASGFHPTGFLSRHPSAAYAREASCSDCHDSRQFCASCHVQAGMTSSRLLGTGANYHDGKRVFLFGHGQAARQGLESCVSCHAERDCLTCHSSVGGRRFNPHGPGFDPNRLARKNPQMCSACHGLNIPRR